MNAKRNKRILAIDPGTKYIGFAAFNGRMLAHYGVATILRRGSSGETLAKGRKIIGQLMDDFHPRLLVVEKTMFVNIRGSVTLNKFTEQILRMGRSRRIKIRVLSANTVRKEICGNGTAGKQDVAKKLVELFPELKPYLCSDKRYKEDFFYNIFDAVALGLASSRI